MVKNIGIIGHRNHAQRLIDIVNKSSRFKINSIYHPEKKLDIENATNNFDVLLDNDGIIISSPNHTHFDYLVKCLDSFEGLIFCEKPPVITKREYNELCSLPDESKKRIYFNFNFRYSEQANILRSYLNSEDLGEVLKIEFSSVHGLAFKESYRNSWRANLENNQHAITQTVGVHFLDLIASVFGTPKRFEYFPSNRTGLGNSYDTALIVMSYEDGPSVTIFTSYAGPYKNEFEMIGTNGIVHFGPDKLEVFSPRDEFDEDGRFITPKRIKVQEIDQKSSYSKSLFESVSFFLQHVEDKEHIPLSLFDSSMISTKLLLDMT